MFLVKLPDTKKGAVCAVSSLGILEDYDEHHDDNEDGGDDDNDDDDNENGLRVWVSLGR